MARPTEQLIPIQVRLPVEIRERLDVVARSQHRSMAAQARLWIEQQLREAELEKAA